jgi:hypothetical protein
MKKLSLICAIAVCALLVFQACKKDRNTVFVNTGTNNTGGNQPTSFPISILSAWSKQAPQKQSFTVNAASGGWVVGAKGCKFYFPSNVLLDKNNNPVTGSVDIELREYMTKGDMLFSGVTVTSGNKLLESGGMFYLMAKKDGQELHLKDNSGFQMQVPQTNDANDVMNIWFGEPNLKDSLNKVNWVKDTVQVVPKNDSGGQKRTYFQMFDYFKFGYCNIDREWMNFKTLIKKFRVKMPSGCNDTNSTALLLFKNYNCCAWCYWLSGEKKISTSYGLPLGETAKVLVYKKTGKGEDDLEYAIKEFTFTDDTEVEFTVMTKCTNKQLEDLIKAL